MKRKKDTKKNENGKETDKTKVYKPIKDKKKKEKKEHPKLRLFFKIMLILIVLAMLICGGVIAGIFMGFFGDDFKLDEEQLKVSNLNTEIYDRDGNLIATLNGDESRKWINIGDMAEYLPIAFVSIEDERFEEHHGVDIKRTAAATVKWILSKIGIGEADYGGSTITQQLVKNLTKENERDVMRKVKEMARAYNIEKTLSKQQILELYLNLIFLGGQSIHGVELGSQYYFSKSASDLSLAECAFLAGINNSPNIYEPFSDDPEEIEFVKNRVKTVLAKMKELGNIKTEEEYNNAVAEVDNGLAFKKGALTENIYSYHTDAVIDQVWEQIEEENPDWSDVRIKQYLYGGGLRIYTTQNTWVQNILEEEVKQSKYQVESRQVEGDVSQTAMVIIDHTTGQVAAVVGGSGEKTTSRGYNFATMEPKQTGSAMKPLSVIAPAVQNGIITAGSVYDDTPTQFPGHSYGYPKNYYYSPSYWGLSTVRFAIEISQNIVPMRILNEMGVDKSIEFLKSVGITTLTDTDQDLAIALGGLTRGVTPLEMAGAYAAIANDGEYIEPTFYIRIEDSEGNVVMEPKQEKRRVMSVENAYIVKSILTQPVLGSRGTASYCKVPNIDTAAKTGTTDDDYDRWLCGFTPYFTATTWFGFRQNETIRGFSRNPAGMIWDSVMTQIHNGLPSASFEKPANITYATICKDSGLLATDLCRNDQRGGRVYTEVFVKGTAPNKTCDCHVRAKVCQEGGTVKLANDNCPNAVEMVFITRKNSNKDTSWKSAYDAKFMLPTETCTTHKETDKKPNNTINNTITNTMTNTSSGKNNTTNTTNTTNKTNTTTNTNTNTNTNKITNTTITNKTPTNSINNLLN